MHSKGAILFAAFGGNIAPTRSLRLAGSQVIRSGSIDSGAGAGTDASTCAGAGAPQCPDAGGLA
jgi:hypothetical protein